MSRIIINGVATQYLSVMDRGLHYGDGIFETIACVENNLQFWQQHMLRMATSADKLGLAFPGEQNFLHDIHSLLAAASAPENCVIKLMLTRGIGDRGYRIPAHTNACRMVMASDWPWHIKAITEQGARVRLCATQVSINPQLAGIKHLARMENVLARNEWQDEFDEGLMSDLHGYIIEGTMSNLFASRDGVLYTPSLQHSGIDGIMRQQVMAIARQQGLEVQEVKLRQADLLTMDELMLSNSLIGVCSVREFAGKSFLPGKMSIMLRSALHRRIVEHGQVAS